MNFLHFNKIFTQELQNIHLAEKNIQLNILRLDELHTVVSGNKWFKLKYYIKDATSKGYGKIATFGGAYSNHVLATAFACKEAGLESIGIIRGEEPRQWSYTLLQAKELGMRLIFMNRTSFKDKENRTRLFPDLDWYWVDEGGYGIFGAMGAAEIMGYLEDAGKSYTHIICAAGTGTMMAGLIKSALPHQTVIGINILKNKGLLPEMVALLNEEEKQKKFILLNEYHFGGYAKHPPQLIQSMKELWQDYKLPTDIVYTSKMMFAVYDLIQKEFFSEGSKLIAIHSGGLQGNSSLLAGTLPF